MGKEETQKVLDHHLKAFGSGNVKDIMADYSEDSILILPDKTLKGLKEIRPVFEEFTSKLLPPGSDFSMDKMEVHDDLAYIFWKGESKNAKFHVGTDTFIVKNGKILKQTFAGHVESK
jgi:ketosteroid isomerase-like protein